MDTNPAFSVIVNFKNDEECVRRTLIQIELMLDKLRMYGPVELILVDEASIDRTLCLLYEAESRLSRFQCRVVGSISGYSHALRTGVAVSSGSVICTLDGAQTYHPDNILNMVEIMTLSGCDIVTGSPYHPWANVRGRHAPARFMSKLINRACRAFTGTNLYCYTCFFRVYRREWLMRAQAVSDGYAAVTELLIGMARRGAAIVEYPILLEKVDYGATSDETMKVVLEHLGVIRRLIFKKTATAHDPRPARENPLSHWALTSRLML